MARCVRESKSSARNSGTVDAERPKRAAEGADEEEGGAEERCTECVK